MKKILAVLLALAILLPCCGYIRAEETDEISAEAFAEVDAMWEELNLAEGRAKKGRSDRTTAETVAAAVEKNDLYVDGTLSWQGNDSFTFETTTGVTCAYSARIRNIAKKAVSNETVNGPETRTVSYGKPGGPEIYLIEPYYGLDENFTEQYQKQAESLAKTLEGTYHLCMRNAAGIDAVAEAVEKGSVIFFDSHGETDWARGSDCVSGARTSYLLLHSHDGLTKEDFQRDENGIYHACNYGTSGEMHVYAVDGTCIANHMKKDAKGGLLWMSLCFGMATDGLEKPLRDRGIPVVYGYSQSVTFQFDYAWGNAFWREMKAGKTVAEAIKTMKSEVGTWDNYDMYPSITSAKKYRAAFPIVVSPEDPYPGNAKADVLQEVHSVLTLKEAAHVHKPVEELVKPTCTKPGWKKITCSVCGEVLLFEEYPALGHDYKAVVTSPTCTEQGYTTYTCTRCGKSYTAEPVPALGHDYKAAVTPPACTEQGYTTYTCRRCGESHTADFVPAAGHRFVNGICSVCGEEKPCEYYTDVKCGDWFYDEAVSAFEHRLMMGVDNGLFAPELPVTRGMLATVLYRNAGSPRREKEDRPFTDVAEGSWYENAVFWAADHGIVNGTGDGKFSPEDSVTREQIAAMLWRYTAREEKTEMELEFPDAGQVSDYAVDAIKWAVQADILRGMDGKLAPAESATRAQLAALLTRWRYSPDPAKT